MYCEKCGTKLNGDSCLNCNEIQTTSNTQLKEQSSNMKTRKLKIFIPIFLILAVIAIIVILIMVLSENKIQVEDYIIDNIKYSGYDGYAKVETFEKDIIDYDSLYTALEIKQPGLESIMGSKNVLKKYFDISCDKNESENLKNGDTITYEISVNYDAINNLGDKKLNGDENFSIDYKVSGLEEITEIDPFEGLENVIMCESYSHYALLPQLSDKIGNCNILTGTSNLSYEIAIGMPNENNVGETASVDFSYPSISDNNIKVGDKITVTLKNDVDKYANEYGILFTQTSKEYEVLEATYLTDISNIAKTTYNQLKSKFEKNISLLENSEYTFVDMYFYSEKGIFGYNTTSIVALYKDHNDAYISFNINEPIIASNDKLVDTDLIGESGLKFNTIKEFENHWKNFGGYSTEITFKKIVIK